MDKKLNHSILHSRFIFINTKNLILLYHLYCIITLGNHRSKLVNSSNSSEYFCSLRFSEKKFSKIRSVDHLPFCKDKNPNPNPLASCFTQRLSHCSHFFINFEGISIFTLDTFNIFYYSKEFNLFNANKGQDNKIIFGKNCRIYYLISSLL